MTGGTGFGAGATGASGAGGTTGGAGSMGDRPGTGEVHGGLHSGGRSEEYGGLQFGAGGDRLGQRASSAMGGGSTTTVQDQAEELTGRARELASDARERVERAAGQARETVGRAWGDAEDFLEERGILDVVRDNAVPALAVAFGVGYLLAGSGESRHGFLVNTAKRRLRGAIFGALSAAVMREAQSALGVSGGLSDLLGGSGSRSQSGGSRSRSAPQHRQPSHREF